MIFERFMPLNLRNVLRIWQFWIFFSTSLQLLRWKLLYRFVVISSSSRFGVIDLLFFTKIDGCIMPRWRCPCYNNSNCLQRGSPTKGQNRPNKMGKIELKRWQIIFCMNDFTPLCLRSLVPNIRKSLNLVKITIFLLWKSTKCLFFDTSTALLH
jgi:hypothetical protein